MIMGLVNLILWLLVVGILYLVVVYVLDNVPIPDPANRIIKLVLVVVLALIVILMMLQLVGVQTGVDLPRLGS